MRWLATMGMCQESDQSAELRCELVTRILKGCRADPLLAVRVFRYAAVAGTLPSPILDLGCELGIGSWLLKTQGAAVIGGDNRRDHLAFAHNAFDGLRLVELDGRALPFADGMLGGVCAFSLLELVHPWEAVADEIRRVLMPDGVALLSNAPCREGPTTLTRTIYEHVPDRFPASVLLGMRVGATYKRFRLGSVSDDIWMVVGGHRPSVVAEASSALQALDSAFVTTSMLASLSRVFPQPTNGPRRPDKDDPS